MSRGDIEQPYVVEANHVQRLRTIWPTAPTEEIVVVSGSAFDSDFDLPSTGDLVTVAAGSEVIRGHVSELAFVLEVTE
jgi:hypothetical protein